MYILNMISAARSPKPATVVGFEIAGIREREANEIVHFMPDSEAGRCGLCMQRLRDGKHVWTDNQDLFNRHPMRCE